MMNSTTFLSRWNGSFALLFACMIPSLATAQVDHVVISQIYAGGGNSGSTYNADFVELFNPTGAAVNLTGWSLQYATETNTSGYGSIVALSGTIAPGRYFLVQLATGTNGAVLPATPDLSNGSMNMGTVGGKVILASNTTPITGTGCPPGPSVVDLVGWGSGTNCFEGSPTAAQSNTSGRRRTNSCNDTNNNAADFAAATPPTPRNSATTPVYCYPVQLVITSIVPATPTAGETFNVTVEAHNAAGVPQGVLQATTVQLSTNGNAGVIGGNTTGVIAQGSSSVTITGVTLASGGTNVTLTATRTAGQTLLTAGTSAPFTVLGGSDTSVQFDEASSVVTEGAGTLDIYVTISNPSATQATSVLVALASGNSAAIGGFTNQTITFPAGSSDPQVLTLTIVNDVTCNPPEVITLGLENVTGGEGTPVVGSPSTHVITIEDNDQGQSVQLARQYFDGTGSENWPVVTGAASISTDAGGTGTPPNQRILSAPASWQVNNTTATLELGTIFPNQWSNMAIRARLASLSTTIGNGAEQSDQVRFYVNIDGAGFPATPDLTITGSASGNSRWGFNSTGVASTTAGSPVTVAAPAGGTITNGPSFIVINIPNSASSVQLLVIANNSTGEVWALDNVEIIGNTCPQTFYSEASGNITDPIWSNFPGGPPGPAIINEAASIVVQNGFTVTNSSDNSVSDLTVETGGTLVLDDDVVLTVHGSTIAIDGAIVANEGILELVGINPTIVSTFDPLTLHDLRINTAAGASTDADLLIGGTLELMDGDLDASSGSVTLISDENATGRLGEVSPTASYTGNITVQRYIPGGATNWRMLGSPVEGATVAQLDDDFFTAGFPGSDYPEFIVDGQYWPSIRYYDETIPSADVNAGVLGVESTQTPMEEGRGYAAWSGDSLQGTASFTVDLVGAPNIALDPIELPLTWTDSGNPEADGFNLVSNPVPSPIDFIAIEKGADVQNAYYLYDPATGNMDSWSNGFGIGTADGIIRSAQGFWMKANGPDATATVHESAKVEAPQGGAFGGLEQSQVPMVQLEVRSGINGYSDRSLIIFDLGTPARDADDALKFVFAHPDAPQIATRSSDGFDLQIDMHGAGQEGTSIPVLVRVAIGGTYTIDALVMGVSGLTCLTLEDLSTGTVTPLNGDNSYSFEISETDDWSTPRFMLHASAPIALSTTAPLCAGDFGAAEVQITGDPVTVTWMNASGEAIETLTGTGTIGLDDLEAGNYSVAIEGSGTACGVLMEQFTLEAPFALEASITDMIPANCANDGEGQITVTVLGGVAPYEYLWSNGSTGATIDAPAGTYSLEVTDANGCTLESVFAIEVSEEAPIAQFEISGGIHLVNEPVIFTNTSVNAQTIVWDLGDGTITGEASPTHIYISPGSYTVTLTATDAAGCSVVHSEEVLVQLGTGLTDEGSTNIVNAWAQNGRLYIDHSYSSPEDLMIEVIDATGKLHIAVKAPATPGRIDLNANALPTCIWFVRVLHDQEKHTFKVPLIR